MKERRLAFVLFVLVNWFLFTGVFWLAETVLQGVRPILVVDVVAVEVVLLVVALITEAANRRCRRPRP